MDVGRIMQKATSNAKEEIQRKKVTRSNAKKRHPTQKSHIQREKADSTQKGYFSLAGNFFAMDVDIQRKKSNAQRKKVTCNADRSMQFEIDQTDHSNAKPPMDFRMNPKTYCRTCRKTHGKS